jgi:hypothetical protein
MNRYRLFHGLSQALVGLALFYLWQLVPLAAPHAKREDDQPTLPDASQGGILRTHSFKDHADHRAPRSDLRDEISETASPRPLLKGMRRDRD